MRGLTFGGEAPVNDAAETLWGAPLASHGGIRQWRPCRKVGVPAEATCHFQRVARRQREIKDK